MLVLILLVIAVALIDSINPSTVGPALIYALGSRARRDLALFTAGVFTVSTAGGVVLSFGPGRALLSVVSTPRGRTLHLLELAAGLALLGAAVAAWLARARLARRLAQKGSGDRSAFVLGAGIMAAELPTAIPYLGALVAIIEAQRNAVVVCGLIVLYNLLFVAPLLLLLLAVVAAGERGAKAAARARKILLRHAPRAVPVALALIGVVLLAMGARGFL